MISKTHAVVLRTVPYSETSLVVTWLTRDHGKVVTMIKGARRRKSGFLGQCDLFYTCELLFYFKDYRGIHIVKECTPLNMRSSLRERWKSAGCAFYLSDLVLSVTPVYAVHEGLYHWLDSALDVLNHADPVCAFLFWFELKLLDLMGIAPQLGDCLQCRRGPGDDPGRSFFSCAKGGVYCSVCGAEAGDAFEVPPDALGLLRFWQSSPTWRSAQSSRCTGRQIETAEKLLGLLMQYHMGISLDSRRMAFELLRTRAPERRAVAQPTGARGVSAVSP